VEHPTSDPFVKNLIFLWHVIRASENLLIVAAQRLQPGTLKEYYREHLREEWGHARWLAEDLASVGVDVMKTEIPKLATELVGVVYYLIFHVHPAALLGYQHLLESWPFTAEQIADLKEKYPESLLRTLLYHYEHDPSHLVELEKQIEELPEEGKTLVRGVRMRSLEYLMAATATFNG
jgi:hypothetical protein